MPSAITPLANVTLGSNAATITFSSINQSYQDLLFVFNLQSVTAGDFIAVRVGGFTSLYGFNMYDGNGTNRNAWTTVNSSFFQFDQNYQSIETARLNAAHMYICDYSATNRHKSVFLKTGRAGQLSLNGGRLPNNSTAITSITFSLSNWSFAAGSSVALYGVSST
jgi:hypothetical protein